jgi:hypothetical protein
MASTSPLLHGYLDPNHTSSLQAYWIHHPTPWPFLLISVLLSLVLGFIGYQTSSKSWSPKKPKKNTVPVNAASNNKSSFIEPYPSYPPLKQNVGFAQVMSEVASEFIFNLTADRAAKRRRWQERAMLTEARLHEQWHREGRVVNEEDDNTMHAGFGKFALIRTAVGLVWTTIRSAALFAFLVKIMLGSNEDFPGVISIVILFVSAQAYLGSRAMPRIAYILIFLDLLMIYGSIGLTVYGFWKTQHDYEKFGVSGGNCPCLLGTAKLGFVSCAANATTFSSDTGCNSDYLWSNNNQFFPKACADSTVSPGVSLSANPNQDATHLWNAEVIVGTIGLLYGLFVLYYGLLWVNAALKKPKLVMRPLPFSDRGKMIRAVRTNASFALLAIFSLTILTLTVHILDETRPINLFYEDSSASWSDCFELTVPMDKNGFLKQWWNDKEDRLFRGIAVI